MNKQLHPSTQLTPPLERLFTDLDLERAGYGSRSKLRKDRMKGIGIPFVYQNKMVRYRESEVLAFLEANRATHALQQPGRKEAGQAGAEARAGRKEAQAAPEASTKVRHASAKKAAR